MPRKRSSSSHSGKKRQVEEIYYITLLQGSICLSSQQSDEFTEETRFIQSSSSSDLVDLHKNLTTVTYCPHILPFKYVDYNSYKIIFSNFSTLEDKVTQNHHLYFGENGDIFTQYMKVILFSVLRGYNTLTEEGLEHSQGDDPKTIVFLETDKKNMFPKVWGRFRKGNSENNFKKLRTLLLNLMGENKLKSDTVNCFLEFLNFNEFDFSSVYNNPGLWSPGSSERFVVLADGFLEDNQIREKHVRQEIQLFPEFMDWDQVLLLGTELHDYLVESQKYTSYSYNIYGLIKFQRNSYVHYNDLRDSIFKLKTATEIEAMFVATFPNILSRGYHFMFTIGFRFGDD